MVRLVISGGQTGPDRAGLDAATALGIPIGGRIPTGRWAEDGPIPGRYAGLVEVTPADLARITDRDVAELGATGPPSLARALLARTRANVAAADATLVFISREPGHSASSGTQATIAFAERLGTPIIRIPLDDVLPIRVGAAAGRLRDLGVETLNVAGPRQSEHPGAYEATLPFLRDLFRTLLA